MAKKTATKSPKPAAKKPAAKQAKKPAKAAPKAAGKPAPAKAAALGAEFTKALTRHFDRLGKKLSVAAVRYVERGDNPEVLLKFDKEAGKSLALAGISTDMAYTLRQAVEKERLDVFRKGKGVPAAAWMRLGEVFDAAGRVSGRKTNDVGDWPDWLSTLLGELLVTYYDAGRSGGAIWPAERLLPIFAEAELPPREAIRLLLDSNLLSELRTRPGYSYFYGGTVSDTIDGWPAVLAQNTPAVREVLEGWGRYHAVQIIPLLNQLKFDFVPVIDIVTRIGVDSSKQVRDAALPALHQHAAAALPHVEKLLAEGNSAQRNEAATILWKLEGPKAVEKLRKHLEGESSEKIRQTIDKLLAAPTAEDAGDAPELELPPLNLELGEVALPGEARTRLRGVYEKAHEQAMKEYEQEMTRWNDPNRPKWMNKPTKPEPLAAKELDELCDFISGARKTLPERNTYRRPHVYSTVVTDESFAPPGVHLIHIVRLCYALNRLNLERSEHGVDWYDLSDLEAYRNRCETPFGLRELDSAVATLPNGKSGRVAFAYLQNNTKYHEFCNWEPEAIWPAFADRLDLLREVLAGTIRVGQYDYYLGERKRNAFKVLAAFPKLPPGFVPVLWDIAMGDAKTDRPLAQAALRSLPNKAEKIAVGLSNGRQTTREAAAEWLGNTGEKSAIPALKEAFRNEKVEAVKGLLMVALEKLGADVSEFLDRDELLKEAKEAAKKPPKVYSVDLEKLPPVHWQDTGKQVDPKIVQWWVIQSVQQKSATGGPILRRYLGMCRPLDTAALAKFVLTGWLERGHTGEKGALAIPAIAGDADCVRMAEKYIRTWFGQKMSQCKTLIEILAWIKHPMALQVLLAIANRFRTAGLRSLAASLVKQLADREGWTIDELADRTIPDGGFAKPEAGGQPTLVLDYGARQFTAILDDELEPVLRAEGGKTLKALPAPAKADDPEKAKEAKKAFSDAKKVIKDVVKRQRERLYEGLCTQRAWKFSEWKQFLADHPVVGRMCVRLAWAAYEPGAEGAEKFLGCFRPLEDGSLTNEKDDAVTFPPETLVRLAHTANTPADLAAAWKQHFKDYSVEAVFDQFGRESYLLPEAKQKETEVKDFRGYEIGTYQIRGKLTKLGYVRGEAQDGGWFHEYLKPFRSLGVQAEIAFSGNSLPEEDRRACLGSLSFTRLKADGDTSSSWHRKTLELGKVPPVLLSECYNDLKQLAAEGTGFNPEWEKQSYY
jgi:hypothetical protein